MPTCSIETLTTGFDRRSWTAATPEEAEVIAHKMSINSSSDPTCPNPFVVMNPDGTVRCQFLAGERQQPVDRSHSTA